jgi:flavodoxin
MLRTIVNDRSVDMATAIIYYSKHHGNTKKILDAIAAEHTDVELVDVTSRNTFDLSGYDKIGFASGIYFGKFSEQILNFAKVNLPSGKDVFFIATAGNPMKSNFNAIARITENKNCKEVGRYICKGFDTFGPFRLVGGIRKGHPTEKEIQAAVDFYNSII